MNITILPETAGILLALEGGQYHLDPGPAANYLTRITKNNPRETIAVIVSNNSIAHSEGINDLVAAMTHTGTDRFGVLLAPKSVIEGTTQESPVLRNDVKEWLERVFVLETSERLGVNNLNIYPKRQSDDTFNFVFESAKHKVGYANKQLHGTFEGCDLLIIQANKHPREELAEFIKKNKPKKALIIGLANPLDDARQIQKDTKITTSAATPGQEIKL